MKKVNIVYYISSISHMRCLRTIPHDPKKTNQMIVAPDPKLLNKRELAKNKKVLQNSKSCIKDIRLYDSEKKAIDIISENSPDIFVCTRPSLYGELRLARSCKRVFVYHGVHTDVNHYPKKPEKKDKDIYNSYDLICLGGINCKKSLQYTYKISDEKIVLNALPQLDLVNKKRTEYETKTIMFLGFGAFGGEAKKHNRELMCTLGELNTIAKKHGMNLIFKPSRASGKIKRIMKSQGIDASPIDDAIKNKNTEILEKIEPVYDLLSKVSVVVANGTSSSEFEAVASGVPLVHVSLVNETMFSDKFYTVDAGASIGVTNIKDLEKAILMLISNPNQLSDAQKLYIKKSGFVIDGNHGARAHKEMLRLV